MQNRYHFQPFPNDWVPLPSYLNMVWLGFYGRTVRLDKPLVRGTPITWSIISSILSSASPASKSSFSSWSDIFNFSFCYFLTLRWKPIYHLENKTSLQWASSSPKRVGDLTDVDQSGSVRKFLKRKSELKKNFIFEKKCHPLPGTIWPYQMQEMTKLKRQKKGNVSYVS